MTFLLISDIIIKLIESVIVPLLPLHIFGIFLNMTVSGHVVGIIGMFLKVIIVIFILHVLLLLIQFTIAGSISKKNPLHLLRNMLPAYATALGTQSSAATIPVTLKQTIKNGVRENIAVFVIPLCATIHLSGSTMKIVACAMAIMFITGEPVSLGMFAGFIMMLGVVMIAAPGVPFYLLHWGLVSLIYREQHCVTFLLISDIIIKLIESVIVPLLPLHIFGIFLNMTVSGHVVGIIGMFLKVIIVIFILHVLLLLIQFTIAGSISKKNPLHLLRNMLPAYATALGTQSSAATIPVTLKQTIKNGVRENIAVFVIPLCATIHLSGSTMKIVACAMAIMFITGEPVSLGMFAGFIMMLGVVMIAAPGVPGGAIMAALGVLHSMLGFDETLQALMIALYIAMDSFGTACNVTGDGAIAIVVDKIAGKRF